MKISHRLNLTINEACELARTLREEYGQNCIEADFKKAIQAASFECDEFFEVVTEIFEIHYHEKYPVTGEKTSWTMLEPRNVVHCKDCKAFEQYVREQCRIDQ